MHRLALRAYSPYRDISAIVDVNRQRGKFRGGSFEFAPPICIYVARTERSGVNSRASDKHPPGQLRIGHFRRENADRNPSDSGGTGKMQHRSTFTGPGTAGQHYKLPAPPAARKGIEAGQSRRYADTLPGLAGLLPAFQVVEGGPHDIRQWRDVIRTHGPVSYRGYFRRSPIYDTIRIGDSTRREFIAEKAHTAAYFGVCELSGVVQHVNAGIYCVGQF